MKLEELTGYKNTELYKKASQLKPAKREWESDSFYDEKSMNEIADELKKGGWNPVGTGYYSMVFENPKYPYVLKVFVDKDYSRWLNAIHKIQSNPYVPKIRGKSIRLNSKAKAARLEKLDSLLGENDPIFRNYVPPGVEPTLDNVIGGNKDVLQFQKEHHPGFAQALKLAHSLLGKYRSLDLHIGNFMKRGDTLVITDPL